MGKIISNGIEYSGIQGTTVIPNPEGSPTEELSSIQIGNDIYSIAGGGGGSSQKVLQMKTKTYIGDDTIPLVITFDEIPKCIYSIYGNGLNNTQVRITPFVYGENRATSWYISPTSTNSGMLYNWITYSNDNKTMTISSNASDAGAHWNISGETYTITYFVEVNSGGGSASWKDITGTLTAGQTSISFTDSSILESSTFDFYTSKFGVNPTNISVLNGSITLTFDEQNTNINIKVRVTNDTPIITHLIDLKQLVTGKIWSWWDTNDNPVCSYEATETNYGLYIHGGENLSGWTTYTAIGIDLAYYDVPSNPTSLKLHLSSLDLTDYGGLAIVSMNTKKQGGIKGDTAFFSNERMYIKTAENGNVSETDYTITVDLTNITLGQYLYIGVATGMVENETTGFNNGRNGTESAVVDWIDIE